MKKELTITTPCYNEEDSLPAYFERIEYVRSELEKSGWQVRLILVNAGSRDNTLQLLEGFAKTHPHAEVTSHPKNLGYGGAVKTGMALAKTEWIVNVDADTNYDQALILEMAKKISDDLDIINVSIFAPGGGQGYQPHRRWLSQGATLVYQFALPRLTKGIYTMTCGFRWYRRAIVPDLFPHASDFTAGTEIMLRALLKGYRILEFPAQNRPREQGVSKMRFLAITIAHMRLATATLFRRLGSPLPIKTHLAVIGR